VVSVHNASFRRPTVAFVIFVKNTALKKWMVILGVMLSAFVFCIDAQAQCSICTKTAQQLGEKPARGLNSGILYLAFTPFAIAVYVGYRWWKNNREL